MMWAGLDDGRVGKWQLLSRLGTGSFSAVYLAREGDSGEVAAVKVLKKDTSLNRVDVLQAEVDVLGFVSQELPGHQNLVSLIDVLQDEQHVFIVMEACHGPDLSDILETSSISMDEALVAGVVRQLTTALRDLHRIGVIHRDVKPGNLKLSDDQLTSDVKLIDFGMARMKGLRDKKVEIMGSEEYVAPEVLCDQTYGPACDMWAVGILIYRALSGAFPFNTDDEIQSAPLMFKEDCWSERSFEARDLIRRLLVKQPRMRSTAGQVLGHKWVTGCSTPLQHGSADSATAPQSSASTPHEPATTSTPRSSTAQSPSHGSIESAKMAECDMPTPQSVMRPAEWEEEATLQRSQTLAAKAETRHQKWESASKESAPPALHASANAYNISHASVVVSADAHMLSPLQRKSRASEPGDRGSPSEPEMKEATSMKHSGPLSLTEQWALLRQQQQRQQERQQKQELKLRQQQHQRKEQEAEQKQKRKEGLEQESSQQSGGEVSAPFRAYTYRPLAPGPSPESDLLWNESGELLGSAIGDDCFTSVNSKQQQQQQEEHVCRGSADADKVCDVWGAQSTAGGADEEAWRGQQQDYWRRDDDVGTRGGGGGGSVGGGSYSSQAGSVGDSCNDQAGLVGRSHDVQPVLAADSCAAHTQPVGHSCRDHMEPGGRSFGVESVERSESDSGQAEYVDHGHRYDDLGESMGQSYVDPPGPELRLRSEAGPIPFDPAYQRRDVGGHCEEEEEEEEEGTHEAPEFFESKCVDQGQRYGDQSDFVHDGGSAGHGYENPGGHVSHSYNHPSGRFGQGFDTPSGHESPRGSFGQSYENSSGYEKPRGSAGQGYHNRDQHGGHSDDDDTGHSDGGSCGLAADDDGHIRDDEALFAALSKDVGAGYVTPASCYDLEPAGCGGPDYVEPAGCGGPDYVEPATSDEEVTNTRHDASRIRHKGSTKYKTREQGETTTGVGSKIHLRMREDFRLVEIDSTSSDEGSDYEVQPGYGDPDYGNYIEHDSADSLQNNAVDAVVDGLRHIHFSDSAFPAATAAPDGATGDGRLYADRSTGGTGHLLAVRAVGLPHCMHYVIQHGSPPAFRPFPPRFLNPSGH